MKPRVNVYGRKPGRGARPWLLIPMLILASIFLGSVITGALLWIHGPAPSSLVPGDGRGIALINQVRFLFITIAVPTLLGTMLFGSLLFLQHPRIFVRMRWWQVKAVLLCVGVPVAHWSMAGQLRAVRQAVLAGEPSERGEWFLTAGFVLLVIGACTIFILSRLKPRLGQDWAKRQASRPACKMLLCIAIMWSLGYLGGCRQSPSGSLSAGQVPAGQVPGGEVPCDFSLTLHILGSDTPADPEVYQSQYVVEPDRQLRVALGPGARVDYYPPLTCYVSHQAFADLYRLIVQHRLTLEPTSPDAQRALSVVGMINPLQASRVGTRDVGDTVYRVSITCLGLTHTYATTPSESPPTLMLVNMLVGLRKGVLPVPVGDVVGWSGGMGE